MTEKCCCLHPGWCERHKMMKIGRLFELCQMDDSLGESYRKTWDKMAIDNPSQQNEESKKKNQIVTVDKKGCCTKKKILLINELCPGDILVMTAAIECLMEQYPNQYLVGVKTSCNAIFEHNPHVIPLTKYDSRVKQIVMEYPLIHETHRQPVHFMQGYVEFLSKTLNIDLKLTRTKPSIYISDEEKVWMNQVEETTGSKTKYWLINISGYKNDYTIKKYYYEYAQEIVDYFKGKIQFVQVGLPHHNNFELKNVINFIGKTDDRQFIRLAYNAQGAICIENYLHHLMAALGKPSVTLLSGFLPFSWVHYPTAKILSRHGCLPCCRYGACWKSRVVKLGDGDDKKDDSLCELPIIGEDPVAKCMYMIKPAEVISAVEDFYYGGILTY